MPDPLSVLAGTAAKAATDGIKVIVKDALKETAESVIKESLVKESLKTIEHTSLEALMIQNDELLRTLNDSLLNKEHPLTKVPFESREVSINGVKKEGVFPDFKDYRVFQMSLPDRHLLAKDYVQFKNCNDQLLKAYEKGTLNMKNFSESQIQQIKDGFKPEGYTWHHNEVKGRMELVVTKIHDATAHTGGRSIWGGGSSAR